MGKCMSCEKHAILMVTYGKTQLCKNCATLANVPVWNTREFSSLEHLQAVKADTIQRAKAGELAPAVIEDISSYFDEYIDAGFITSINGKAGQTLKLFRDYCIITTKSEAKKSELENVLDSYDDDDDGEADEILSSDDKKNLVKGLMSGRIVQTGIGVVLSATLNQQEKEKAAERKAQEKEKRIEKMITVGERRIYYRNLSTVEMFTSSNSGKASLRFIHKGASINTMYDCDYYFFNNSIPFESKKIRQETEQIRQRLNAIINETEKKCRLEAEIERQKMIEKQTVRMQTSDTFEEIRKYKLLLDEGIISEEEFKTKKKELLGL